MTGILGENKANVKKNSLAEELAGRHRLVA